MSEDTPPIAEPSLTVSPAAPTADGEGMGEACPLEPGPSAARVRALRWLVRLRAALFIAALIAIVVYVSNGLRPVRPVVFVAYGLLALGYAGVYLYVLATRRTVS